ncbi:MAG: rRNA maturation RNase YbeY [Gammaproteobacteria bacterium]|nr:rRNA maturation RNase YbeY [Gammaproteobacteria bacterium]
MTEPTLDLNIQTIDTSIKLAEDTQFFKWCESTLHYALSKATTVHAHLDWQITLRIVDAEEGQALNRYYRHKDYATNVLSFYYDSPFAGLDFEDYEEPIPENLSGEGDIVLCAPIVVKEAKEQKKSLLEHSAHLIVHATLHLLGYDHETEPDATVMEGLEIAILQQLGFNNPYEEH